MKRMTSWAWVGLVIILLLGASARFYQLGEKSLWSDEIATIATSMGNSIDPEAFALRGERFDPPSPVPASVYLAKATQSHGAGNWGQTAQVLKANVHPPLFFMLMNGWIHQVGLDPGTLRIPAALFGLLSVGMMFGLALKLADWDPLVFQGARREGFALLASAMMALSAYQVDHAQDARQYTLLIVLALSACWLAVSLVQRQGQSVWRWVLLALLLATGLYTQYFFGLFCALIVWLLLVFGGWQKRIWLGTVACGGLVLLLLLPWLPVFREQLVFLKLAGHYTAGLWNPVQLPEKLWRIFCEFFLPENKAGKLVPLLIFLAWGAGFGRHRAQQKLSEAVTGERKATVLSPVLMLILLWLLVLVGGQIGLDLLKDSHTATIRRYLLLASPAVYLLMAYALCAVFRAFSGSRTRWIPLMVTGALLTLMLGDTWHYLYRDHTSSDEFKQVARQINREGQAQDLVLVSKTGAMAVGLAFYLKSETRLWGIDVPSASTLSPGSEMVKRLTTVLGQLPASAGVWLAFSHTAPSTRNRLSQLLTDLGYQAGSEVKVPGVRLTRWLKSPDSRRSSKNSEAAFTTRF